jgi:HD-like signal output (HDOD) protein
VPAKKWATDPAVFWRHSLGCAMVSREFAERIEFGDAEKAYLAGLLHDLGILVTSFAYTTEYAAVIDAASKSGTPLHEQERTLLGFTHCESGGILARAWRLPQTVIEVIECHHELQSALEENGLVALVHLADLLCRSCGLGYGYDEWRGVELAADPAWVLLTRICPKLANMDLVRFTLDMESSVARINEVVETIFARK